MAITYQKPIQVDEVAWKVRWTSDLATPVTFYVYLEGVLVSPGGIVSPDGAGEWLVSVPPGEFPQLDVLDTDCLPPLAFSGHLLLQWYGTGNKEYRVEKLISAVWTLQETITDDGRGYFTWRSAWLEDVTLHSFRIVPVSLAGNQGTALSLVCLMVRNPDNPSVAVTYNGATLKTLHIAAA